MHTPRNLHSLESWSNESTLSEIFMAFQVPVSDQTRRYEMRAAIRQRPSGVGGGGVFRRRPVPLSDIVRLETAIHSWQQQEGQRRSSFENTSSTSSHTISYEPPPPPRIGFTRCPKPSDILVCVECDEELVDGLYAAKCGHVYCAECASSRKKTRGRKSAPCALLDCNQRVIGRTLIEIFI